MDIARVDPLKLRHFLAVLDGGSFARAAGTSGISQPAMSKSIAALEQNLGERLFERGRAGACATPIAQILARHARIILAEYSLAQAEIRAVHHASAHELSIGSSPSLAQSLLPRAISRFRNRWPAVAISVEVGFSNPLFTSLLAGDIDLVLSAPEGGATTDTRLSQTFLLEEYDRLVVGANHPLVHHDKIELADLIDYPWIVPRRSDRLNRIHSVFAAAGLPPPSYVLRSESSELARGLLMEQPFICLIGADVLGFDIAEGALRTLPDLGFSSSRLAFLSRRRGSHLGISARNLSLVVEEVAREIHAEGPARKR